MTPAITIMKSRGRKRSDMGQDVICLKVSDYYAVKSQVEAFQPLLKLLRGYNPDMPMGAGMKAQFQALLEEIEEC